MSMEVAFAGRLVATPEIRYSKSGCAVATFPIRYLRPTGEDEADNGWQEPTVGDYVALVLVGPLAENAVMTLSKGTKVVGRGHLRHPVNAVTKKLGGPEIHVTSIAPSLADATVEVKSNGVPIPVIAMIDFEGTLVDHPEIRYSKNGAARVLLRVALPWSPSGTELAYLGSGDPPEPSWLRIFAYGELAEHAALSLEKGMQVAGTGELRSPEWIEDDDGSPCAAQIVATTLGPSLATAIADIHKHLSPQSA